jgi:hypothetical protein
MHVHFKHNAHSNLLANPYVSCGIFGPVDLHPICTYTSNEELNRSINRDDMKFAEARRIRWLGHVQRMEVGAMPRKMMEGRLFIGRSRGRPRLRWMDDVVADLKIMKIKQWMEKTKDSEQWRLDVEEAKAHPGL